MKIKTGFDDEQKHQRQDGPLSNWAKRKQAVLREQEDFEEREARKELDKAEQQVLLTDEDMPPIESLTADSDYTVFMSPKVSDALRRLALRKLFHGAEFNICDGLDDYDGDYASFAKLGSIVTSDMKHQIEKEARKKVRLAEEQEAEERLANNKSAPGGKVNDDARLEVEPENEMATPSKALDTEYIAVGETDEAEYDDEDNLDGGLPG